MSAPVRAKSEFARLFAAHFNAPPPVPAKRTYDQRRQIESFLADIPGPVAQKFSRLKPGTSVPAEYSLDFDHLACLLARTVRPGLFNAIDQIQSFGTDG